jgi:hypothetical protein
MIRRVAKPVSILLTISMLLLSLPHKSALAGMIGTETVLDATRSQEARDYLNRILAREDVRASLVAQGIDPLEAKARVDSLSDAEVVSLADQIEELPAGGSALGILVGALLIVFIALLITDILGYTDVFPFVKKHSEVKKDSDNK